ncbi:MAG: hypothetical protein KF851_18165 [Pirellulaceae bacterium]|nr:hypothetical protein [Pirellulaceae bacterium]
MAFHIPFEYRNKPQPIYIGFDAPPRPKRQRNRTGLLGFLLSIFSIFTFGLLSPIALLVCLVGLRKRPRGLATAGTVISLIGTSVIAIAFTGAAVAESRHRERIAEQRISKLNQEKLAKTVEIMGQPLEEISLWVNNHDGHFPDPITGNMLTIKFEDGWGQPLRFEIEGDQGIIRSAGADKKFDTRDDITKSVTGKLPEIGKVSVEVNPPENSTN